MIARSVAAAQWTSTAILVAVLALSTVGCASTDPQLDAIESNVAEIQRQLLQLQQNAASQGDVSALEEQIAEETQRLVKAEADLQVELRRLIAQVEQVQAKLDDTNYSIAQLSQRIAATNQELRALRASAPGGDESTPAAADDLASDPEQLYQSAYNDYLRGSYELAILGFRQYLETFPDTEQADNAQYWIGESYFAQGKFPQAIREFDNVRSRYPNSERLPSAILKKGYAYLELQERTQGVNELQTVIREFPRSDEAKLARQLLESLGIDATG